MPKVPRHRIEELHDESEDYNPTRKETRDELDAEEQITRRIGELLYELGRKKTTPHNPFRKEEDWEYGLIDDPSIQHPEAMLMDVDELVRDIKRIKDRPMRETLMKRLDGLEEKIIEHYEPFIHQQVDDAGADIFYVARHEPQQRHKRAARAAVRAEAQIHEALEIMKLWRLPDDTRIKLSAVLEAEQQRLERYEAEPFLYGFERQLDNTWNAIREEREQVYAERWNSPRIIGEEEMYLQTSAFLQNELSTLEELLERFSVDEARAECARDLASIREAVAHLEHAKKEALKRIKPRKPREDLEPRDWAFSILGLPKTATKDDVRKAFRSLAVMQHPDKAPEEERGAANAKMKEIIRAYSILQRT